MSPGCKTTFKLELVQPWRFLSLFKTWDERIIICRLPQWPAGDIYILVKWIHVSNKPTGRQVEWQWVRENSSETWSFLCKFSSLCFIKVSCLFHFFHLLPRISLISLICVLSNQANKGSDDHTLTHATVSSFFVVLSHSSAMWEATSHLPTYQASDSAEGKEAEG